MLAYEDPRCRPEYAQILSGSCWQSLESRFLDAHRLLHGIRKINPLDTIVRSGIMTVGTAACPGLGLTEGNNVRNCPTCSPAFQPIGPTLPRALESHTHLICKLSGEVMDDSNPPLAFPSGHVYSSKALKALADSNSDELVTCPATGEEFPFGSLLKLHII